MTLELAVFLYPKTEKERTNEMSKLFMYGSDLQELEQLMMLVPNFLPRRSGVIVVQRIRNEPEPFRLRKKGKLITEYCNSESNDLLTEQVIAGHINYEEVISKCFKASDYYSLNKRLQELARSYGGNFFLNPIHESRFKTVCRIQGEPNENRETTYLAALFLLTANDKLWCAAKDHVYLDSFDFKKMHLNSINTDGYALCKCQCQNVFFLESQNVQLLEFNVQKI